MLLPSPPSKLPFKIRLDELVPPPPPLVQLSVAVAPANVTGALHKFVVLLVVIFAGHVIAGALSSLTVIVNEQLAVFGGVAASFTV
jgi:hypothetical protein